MAHSVDVHSDIFKDEHHSTPNDFLVGSVDTYSDLLSLLTKVAYHSEAL